MRIAKILVVAAAIAAFPVHAEAGILPGLNLHGEIPDFSCGFNTGTETCESINPNSLGIASQEIIVLLTGIPSGAGGGASGVQFGIDYSSTGTTAAFNLSQACSPAYQTISLMGPNGDFPTDGSGVAMAFGGCVQPVGEDGIIPVVLLFTTNAPTVGTMTIVPDPQAGDLVYTNCGAMTQQISKVGEFDWEGTNGFANCFPPPATVEVTWGQVKAAF